MPPGWDGIETIEKLWQIDDRLEIVICSAYSDYTWEEISDRPFSELKISAETREFLEPAIFFDALPFTERVVYISTPHRGSYQARRRIAG